MKHKNMLIKLRGSTGRNWGKVIGEHGPYYRVSRREVGDILLIEKRLVVRRKKHLRELSGV